MEDLEKEQAHIESKIWEFSLTLLQPFYEKRRTRVQKVERFWPIVLESSELLAEYMSYEDTEAMDSLEDLYVYWDKQNPKNFTVEMKFQETRFFPTQTVSKSIIWDEEAESFGAVAVELEWKQGRSLANKKEGSFFDWFTYSKPDDSSHAEISQLISDEIFPHALDFYRAAQEGEEDEWDISSDEAS